jgi:DNA primase catalytic subunit
MRSLVRDAVPDYVRQAYDEVERRQRISNEVENGEVLDLKEVRKMMSNKAVKKKKKVGDDVIDDLNFQSAILEREIRKAIDKAKKLKTEKVDVKKTKLGANDVILSILHGGVSGYDAVKKVMECSSKLKR